MRMKISTKMKMMREMLKSWLLVISKMTRLFIISQPFLSKLFMNSMKLVRSVLCTVKETTLWLAWKSESIMVFILNPHSPKVFSIELQHNYLENLSTLLLYFWNLWWNSHSLVKNKWSISLSRMFSINVVQSINKIKPWSQEKYLLQKSEVGSKNSEPWDWKFKWNSLITKKLLELIQTNFLKRTENLIDELINLIDFIKYLFLVYFFET